MTTFYNLKFRVHEWLADRISWIQYPNVSGPTPQFFKNQMPASIRIGLVVFGLSTLAVCAVALFLLGVLAYSVLKS